jgi:general transcription factor 3C polypeptide 3 (transcription factor C subunit 4)
MLILNQNHLEFLHPDEADVDYLEDNAHLIVDAASALREAGNYSEALRFYESLQATNELIDTRTYFDMAVCYQALGRFDEVRAIIRNIREGPQNPDLKLGLAKLYQAQGKIDLMWRMIFELKRLGKLDMARQAGLPTTKPDSLKLQEPQAGRSDVKRRRKIRFPHRPKSKYAREQLAKEEVLQNTIIHAVLQDLRLLQDDVEAGKPDALSEWFALARELFEDFNSQKILMMRDRTKRIMDKDVEAAENSPEVALLRNYRGIEFQIWMDFLLEYGIRLADSDKLDQGLEVLKVAEEAAIISADRERLLMAASAALSTLTYPNLFAVLILYCRMLNISEQ